MRLAILIFAALLAAPLAAQTPGSCAHGVANARLVTDDLSAELFNNGNLFFGGATTNGDGYTVAGGTGLFAANLWVGGTISGDPRTAAATFQNFEFWPGPLDATVGAGTHTLRVPPDLPAGTYLVAATAGTARVTTRFTVAH